MQDVYSYSRGHKSKMAAKRTANIQNSKYSSQRLLLRSHIFCCPLADKAVNVYLSLPEWPHSRLHPPPTLVILHFELPSSFAANYLLRQCSPRKDHSLREEVPAWFTYRSFLEWLHTVPLRRISALAKKVSSGILPKPCIILCVSPTFASLPTLSVYIP